MILFCLIFKRGLDCDISINDIKPHIYKSLWIIKQNNSEKLEQITFWSSIKYKLYFALLKLITIVIVIKIDYNCYENKI